LGPHHLAPVHHRLTDYVSVLWTDGRGQTRERPIRALAYNPRALASINREAETESRRLRQALGFDARVRKPPYRQLMLTEAQLDVLIALSDACEIRGSVELDPARPLPNVLASLGRPAAEVQQAVADLHELDLITRVVVAECQHPSRSRGSVVFTRGQQKTFEALRRAAESEIARTIPSVRDSGAFTK